MKKNTEEIPVLALSTDTGNTGIPHLKRLWGKIMFATIGQYDHENDLDAALLNLLGLGLLPTYQFLHEQRPELEDFEAWVLKHFPDGVPADTIQTCYKLLGHEVITEVNFEENILSQADLASWEENGYVIVRSAISQEDCQAARKAIWNFLKMDEHDPQTWYDDKESQLQGIMVPLFRDVAIDKNRHTPRIRMAFEQLWQQQGLIVTTDKCGFNPPETKTAKYRGIGLHWDVSLARPIPFGTQGILYLTDTASNQGALTVVPGFHKKLDNWLQALPPGVNPREFDFSSYNPIGIAANAGDCIIWDHRLPHSSSPNRAKLPRLVQYLNWYPPLQKTQSEWI